MRLNEFYRSERDLILMQAGGKELPDGAIAEMNRRNTVMTLDTDGSFERPFPGSLRRVKMVAGRTWLHDVLTGVTALLHELTHSKDALYTDDHTFQYNCSPSGDENVMSIHLYPTEHPIIYEVNRLESCLALLRRDRHDNFNRTSDNATAGPSISRSVSFSWPTQI